jgi:hypothetical protein
MPAVKPISQAAAKFVRNAGAATAEYAQNAKAAGDAYASGAVAAAPTYKAAISAPNIQGAYASGVQRAGAAKYSRGVEQKGSARYGPGVQAAQGDYSQAVAPYFDTIQSTTLPARGVRGSPGNIQRVAALATALNQKRQQMKGAGR